MLRDDDGLVEPIPSEQQDLEEGMPIYRIASYPSDLTLEGLHLKWQRGEIQIPRFQRRWVWNHSQASQLIESFLVGLPVPSIFVYRERSTETQLVIDGQQRLRTIFGFFEGDFPGGGDFYLKGTDSQWEGKTYTTDESKSYQGLTESERIRLRDSVLRVIVIEQLDPEDDTSIYHIFERLNTGGTGLTPQEIRNCTSHGPFNDLLAKLNQDRSWRDIFGTQTEDVRMRDLELILRFSALSEPDATYAKPIKKFLNDFMAKHKRDTALESREGLFLDTTKRVLESLGPRPFHIKRGFNAAVFDSVMVVFAKSARAPTNLKERYDALLNNPSFKDSISAGTIDVDVGKRRIDLAAQTLFG